MAFECVSSYVLWLRTAVPHPLHMSCLFPRSQIAPSQVSVCPAQGHFYTPECTFSTYWREDSCASGRVHLCLLLTRGTDALLALVFPVLPGPSTGYACESKKTALYWLRPQAPDPCEDQPQALHLHSLGPSGEGQGQWER